MELHVWEGEQKWGLPSMDLESLKMMAYVKFSGAPVTITKTTNPFRSPTGILPVFKCSEGCFSDFNRVAEYLRKQNYSCDYELTPRQCSEVIAYDHLLKEKLYPALVFLWWVEPKSYYDIIHKWYFRKIPFPFKFVYPGRFHEQHASFIDSLFDGYDDTEFVETELHKQAQECLTMLSNRLGEREYFFGRNPTTLDAILFGYLILLLKIDLKVPVLQNHIKACPNLLRYVSKIMQKFFPNDSTTKKEIHKETSGKDDVPNKGINFVASTLVAASAMLGYAFAIGLVQVDLGIEAPVEEEDEYEYDDYDSGGSSNE